MYMPASNSVLTVPVLLTFATPNAKTHRRRAVVSTLNRELDSLDVEGDRYPSSPWASIQDSTNIVVQVWPGVSSIGAVKRRVTRAIPSPSEPPAQKGTVQGRNRSMKQVRGWAWVATAKQTQRSIAHPGAAPSSFFTARFYISFCFFIYTLLRSHAN
jgi:hypothetical protein